MRRLARVLDTVVPMVIGALVAAPSARAGVFVVDPGGGGDFTNPADAIAAAHDGDCSPVRSGSSGSVSVSGPPNKSFGLFSSLGMGYLPKASLHGAFLLGSPLFGPLIIASTNAGGTFTAPFIAPSLTPFGLEGLLNLDQAIMLQVDGTVVSGATASIQVQPPN